MNTSIICRDPWSTLFVGTYNEARTCCAGNTILGDLNRQSLDEILNSDKAKEIRTSMSNGIWPENCSQCEKLENQGARSYREPTLSTELIELISADPTNYLIRTLDFRWNNTCTLACNYCSEKFSSSWAVIKNIDIGTDRNYYNYALDWVKENCNDIKKILMLGGEPLIIKENAKILDILKDQDIEIMVGTSLAVELTTPVFEKLKNVSKVYVNVSFENIGDRYEYVRHNASWDLLLKNIKLVKQMPNFSLSAIPIYNIYSALDLYNYYQFLLDQEFVACHWNRVHHPKELDVLNHSPEVKKLALDELYRTRDQFADTYIYDNEFFQSLIHLLETSTTQYSSGMTKFTHDIENIYHKNKRHKFFELWPEFENLIK
jgi:organic radical activating enzyme